jgi:hypothetical protein
MAAIGTPLFDANIDDPFECEGSPQISTDEVTRATMITRMYCQKAINYIPLIQGTKDYLYPNAFLINEQTTQHAGPVIYFSRNYAQIPSTRVEPLLISFTNPGKSAVQISRISGRPIGWDKYGGLAPSTQQLLARVTFTYARQLYPTQVPATLFTLPALSNVTYLGAVVDFTGQVYVNVGNETVSSGPPAIIENRWQLQGATAGFVSGNWIVARNIRRWRGNIFELEVISLDSYFLP